MWKAKFGKQEVSTIYTVLHEAEGAVLGADRRFALLVAMPALTRGATVGIYLEAERALQVAA